MIGTASAIWFFVVGLDPQSTPFSSSRLGPLTEQQCLELRAAVPSLPGTCRRLVAVRNYSINGGKSGTNEPIFEGEEAR